MGWLEKLRRRRAAKRLAQTLPRILHENWGRSETYSVGQIERALKLAKLGGRYESIAFAALLTREDYLAHMAKLRDPLDYEEANAVLADVLAGAPWPSYAHEPMSNADAASRYGLGG